MYKWEWKYLCTQVLNYWQNSKNYCTALHLAIHCKRVYFPSHKEHIFRSLLLQVQLHCWSLHKIVQNACLGWYHNKKDFSCLGRNHYNKRGLSKWYHLNLRFVCADVVLISSHCFFPNLSYTSHSVFGLNLRIYRKQFPKISIFDEYIFCPHVLLSSSFQCCI